MELVRSVTFFHDCTKFIIIITIRWILCSLFFTSKLNITKFGNFSYRGFKFWIKMIYIYKDLRNLWKWTIDVNIKKIKPEKKRFLNFFSWKFLNFFPNSWNWFFYPLIKAFIIICMFRGKVKIFTTLLKNK